MLSALKLSSVPTEVGIPASLESAAAPTTKMTDRLGSNFLGKLAKPDWLPFATEVKKCIHDEDNLGVTESDRVAAIKEATADLKDKDLVYFVSSRAKPTLSGWEVDHRILLVTKEGLSNPENLKSLRIYEDIFKGEKETGVMAALSWKERYNDSRRLFVIEDSYVAIRSGFQRALAAKSAGQTPTATGWGSEIYSAWLDFVEKNYSPRDILKIIVASKKIESILCQRYEGAKEIYETFYGGGEAQGSKQRMYCFNRESPAKILLKTVKEAQAVLQPEN